MFLQNPGSAAPESSFGVTDSNWQTYSLGSEDVPPVILTTVGHTGDVLQIKRLQAPQDLIYSVHSSADMKTGWPDVLPEDAMTYVGPSSEPPYGLWEVDAGASSAATRFFMYRASATAERELVLLDNFEDNLLESNLWIRVGDRIDENNGVLRAQTTVTDNGGQVWTASFPMGNDTIEIIRRTKLHYGNDKSIPKLSIRYQNLSGEYSRACGVFYGNMVYDSPPYAAVSGTVLGLGNANPHLQSYIGGTVQGPPVRWDQWFDEKLSFDNQSGLARYYVNGTEVMNGYAQTIDPNSEVSVYIDAWGWLTGHENDSEYIEVHRIRRP